jgi:hypothetical protein
MITTKMISIAKGIDHSKYTAQSSIMKEKLEASEYDISTCWLFLFAPNSKNAKLFELKLSKIFLL